tara:strand:+ start:16972 stop:17166 length:195 start_codon:yes stop_codon:yes gene_type:complete
MSRLSYNEWMVYIYNTLNKKPIKETNTSAIGKRSMMEIQKEIDYLRAKDMETSLKVRSTYKIKR